jgi:hypothetical protein
MNVCSRFQRLSRCWPAVSEARHKSLPPTHAPRGCCPPAPRTRAAPTTSAGSAARAPPSWRAARSRSWGAALFQSTGRCRRRRRLQPARQATREVRAEQECPSYGASVWARAFSAHLPRQHCPPCARPCGLHAACPCAAALAVLGLSHRCLQRRSKLS